MAIAHTCVIDEYRKKYYYLCKNYKNIDLMLYIPDKWLEMNKWQKPIKNKYDSNYRLKICKTIKFWMKKPLLNITYIMPRFLKDIIKEKPDIIDIWEEPYSLISFLTVFLNKNLKIGAKITFFSAQNLIKKYPFPFNIIQKYVLDNSHYSYPISKDVINVLKHHGFQKQFSIIPLGIDSKDSKSNHIDKNNNIGIGFIGRLESYKGIDNVLELFKNFFIGKNVKFHIAGKGSFSKKCELFNDKHENFKYYGFLENNKIKDFYSNIDILLIPSKKTNNWSEQFGRVIIEGIINNCVVLGSNSGEIPNVINNKENIFNEGDINNMYNIINKYIKLKKDNPNKFYNDLEKNKEEIINKYSWDSISKEIYNMYKKML